MDELPVSVNSLPRFAASIHSLRCLSPRHDHFADLGAIQGGLQLCLWIEGRVVCIFLMLLPTGTAIDLAANKYNCFVTPLDHD